MNRMKDDEFATIAARITLAQPDDAEVKSLIHDALRARRTERRNFQAWLALYRQTPGNEDALKDEFESPHGSPLWVMVNEVLFDMGKVMLIAPTSDDKALRIVFADGHEQFLEVGEPRIASRLIQDLGVSIVES